MESDRRSSFCFDAFSSREPLPTSLENALVTSNKGKGVVKDVTPRAEDRESAPSDPGSQAVAAPSGLPPRQRWLALTPIGVAMALATLDVVIANTALPTIAADLRVSAVDSVWVVNAYQLALMVSLLPLASLGEILGYRRIYIAGLILFTVASLACALAWSLPTLAAARVLQGLGASGIVSVNAALVRFIYPARWLGRGVGFVALVVAISSAVGPTVASAILSVATWPWLFAINVPFGILAAIISLRTLPHTRRMPHRFDVWSAILNAVTFSLLILAIGEAAHGAPLPIVLGELLGFLFFGAALIRRQATSAAPLLPVDLFKRPIFALSSLTSCCSYTCQGAAYVALPFFFQDVLGRTQVETGYLMTPWPVAVAIMAPIAGRLSERYTVGILGTLGMVLLCIGMISITFMPPSPSAFDIGWRMVLCGAGFGFFQSPNLRALMGSAPPERSGSASGVIAISRLLGQTVGASMVALCLGLFPAKGSVVALSVAAVFAAMASVASFLRLMTKTPGSGSHK
jgi:MFS transporter, DHA2 family, multidrug resistance protein